MPIFARPGKTKKKRINQRLIRETSHLRSANTLVGSHANCLGDCDDIVRVYNMLIFLAGLELFAFVAFPR